MKSLNDAEVRKEFIARNRSIMLVIPFKSYLVIMVSKTSHCENNNTKIGWYLNGYHYL